MVSFLGSMHGFFTVKLNVTVCVETICCSLKSKTVSVNAIGYDAALGPESPSESVILLRVNI